MIRAVVFDFDGTIIDSESLWYESFRLELEERGVELPVSVFAHGIGTYDNSLYRYIQETFGSKEAVKEIRKAAVKRHQAKAMTLEPREGVVDYLREAQRLGLGIGMATSSPRSWVDPFLTVHGLHGFFDTICTQDDVERLKPDPALYSLAVHRLGVQPGEALAFEDSANGARSAVAAGLRCIIVPNPLTASLTFDHYDLRLGSMAELPFAELIGKFS